MESSDRLTAYISTVVGIAAVLIAWAVAWSNVESNKLFVEGGYEEGTVQGCDKRCWVKPAIIEEPIAPSPPPHDAHEMFNSFRSHIPPQIILAPQYVPVPPTPAFDDDSPEAPPAQPVDEPDPSA